MPYDAIVFDLGNTLLPWREDETRKLYKAVHALFEEVCGPMPDFYQRAFRACDELIHERESTTMREVTIEEFVERICHGDTPDGLVQRTHDLFHRVFVELCRFPDDLDALLGRLRAKRPLAVLSNFVLTEPIEEVLKRAGLWDHFVHVEVSATSGYMKPHPEPFEIVREKLGTAMERTLMVGDNFYADIVGGFRAGFQTALTLQFSPNGATSDPRAPEVKADRILKSLHELEAD